MRMTPPPYWKMGVQLLISISSQNSAVRENYNLPPEPGVPEMKFIFGVCSLLLSA